MEYCVPCPVIVKVLSLTLQDNGAYAKHVCVQISLDLNYPLFALFNLIDKYVTFGSRIMLIYIIYMTYTCVHIITYQVINKQVKLYSIGKKISPHSPSLPTLPPCQEFFFQWWRGISETKCTDYGISLIFCLCAIFTDSVCTYVVQKYIY